MKIFIKIYAIKNNKQFQSESNKNFYFSYSKINNDAERK